MFKWTLLHYDRPEYTSVISYQEVRKESDYGAKDSRKRTIEEDEIKYKY